MDHFVIIGAGQAGETLVRDLRRTGAYDPVGFLDDAPEKRGARVAGVPVLGTLEDSGKIPAAARQGSGIAADYRLVMDIRHFQAEYAGAALPSVVIEVSAKLLHSQDQAVVGSRSFRHAQPSAGTDVGLVADAFSQALGATSRDIAGWVLVTGQAHEASHPHDAR